MGLFDLFGKKPSGTVMAHVLDPNTGYSQQHWTVGEHISAEAVSRLGDGENIYIVVAFEGGQPKQVACKKEIWEQTRAQFDGIEAAGAESMQRMMDELKKLR
jgi:hypothetical protein